ncbi:helix-turn-helix domain-containing protein [Xanthobacter sp. KR7-65]|uniref:winged helix-turn-helix transcriptional regulator n=1 Tax=Xanthobacter sp. KR7-65 TaxID=3156612 RepID=UPI0032B3E3D5
MKSEAKLKQNLHASCAAEPILKFFAQEWTSHIVAALSRGGTLRFGQLRRALPGAPSAKVLSARLKALEAGGYVARREIEGRVRLVEYSLTDAGRAADLVLAGTEALAPPRTSP